MTDLHRLTYCSVCGEPVLSEAGSPRLYRADDAFEPHYCQPIDITARLEASRASALVLEAAESPPDEAQGDTPLPVEPVPVQAGGLGGFAI